MLTLSVCLVLSASIFAAADLQYQGGEGLYHNYNGEYAHSYDNYEPKGYQFEYAVSDPHTGDHKSQWEVKDKAGVVRGGYSLLEPDGTTRVVEYIADKNGFRAVVKKLGTAIHPGHAASHANVELDDSSNLHPLSENALYSSYNGHINNYANNVINLDSVHLPQEVHSGLEAVVVPEAHSYGGEISGHTLSLSPEVITLAQPHEEVSHGYVAQPQVLSAGWSNILAPKAEGIYIQAPKEVYSIPQYATAKSEAVYSLPQYVAPKSEGLYTSLPVVQTQYALPQVHQVSSVGAAHPYGESSSSSNYYGVTNNPDDDSEYSVDDGHQGWQGVKGLPYNLALNY